MSTKIKGLDGERTLSPVTSTDAPSADRLTAIAGG